MASFDHSDAAALRRPLSPHLANDDPDCQTELGVPNSSGNCSSSSSSSSGCGRAITDETLYKWNLGACLLHFVQGTLLLVSAFLAPGVKDFEKDITTNWLAYDEATDSLVSKSETVGTIRIGLVAAIFLLMSAVAHAYVLIFWSAYIADIKNECNHARWYEYAVSSSLMIVAIAVLFGCYDVASLLLISVCNASMCLFGLLMELMNPPGRDRVMWLPFWFGCFAGVGPWVVVFMYFLGGGNFSDVPGFVYGILAAYLVCFNTFPVNMYLQYAKIGKWADYRYGELGYITLSLVSKSFLGWLVFGGTFQPNGDDDER